MPPTDCPSCNAWRVIAEGYRVRLEQSDVGQLRSRIIDLENALAGLVHSIDSALVQARKQIT